MMMLFVISTAVIGVPAATISLQYANAASNDDNSSCSHHDIYGNRKNAPKMIRL
jgi:hypothetical protein